MKLEIGAKAPAFRLASTDGREVALEDLAGKTVVLYFYPKDQTPGCTREACDFRDSFSRLGKSGAVVYGVSKDSLGSHERFREKYELPFGLLSDPDNAAARAYGAYGEKVMYGKPVTGTIRSTFVIDPKGRVARVWSPVKVEGHVDEVLAFLQAKRSTTRKAVRAPAGNGARQARR
ncbi:MAG: peroxiredoxin [Deltaproteobacteria bacterium]|nr:peroxiredoxin [Deltaproteobacteria bacterium]